MTHLIDHTFVQAEFGIGISPDHSGKVNQSLGAMCLHTLEPITLNTMKYLVCHCLLVSAPPYIVLHAFTFGCLQSSEKLWYSVVLYL